MPDWRDEVRAALGVWIEAEGGAGGVARWKPVGRARAEAERGWFAVDTRGARADVDQLDMLRIGPSGEAPDGAGYPVMEVLQDGQVLRVRVAQFVELTDPVLWQFRQPTTHLLTRLRDGIAAMGDAGLAHELAAGRLGPRPADSGEPAGFRPEQRAAYAACWQPGVRLVWGPPGTGKTRVLAEAIGALASAGKRVLLVSATNIAVDNALWEVVRQRRHAPGELVRIGPPHLPEIAEDASVSLARLVRDQLADVERRRLAVQQRLMAIQAGHEEAERLQESLAGFDLRAYEAARRLLAAEAQCAALAGEADVLARRRAQYETAVRTVDAKVAAAAAAVHSAAPARAAFAAVDRLADQHAEAITTADELALQLLRAGKQAGSTKLALRDLEGRGRISQAWNRAEIARLHTEADRHQLNVEELTGREAAARALANRYEQALRSRRADLELNALYSREIIRALDEELRDAQLEHADASRTLRDAAQREADALAALRASRRTANPTEQDRDLVAHADERDQPGIHARLNELRASLHRQDAERNQLERAHKQIQDEFEKLRRDAEGEIIKRARVLATTLARFRTTKALLEGVYDVVLVDEAAAATLPEILLAVSRASNTAVLLGDFLQLAAVTHRALAESRRPEVGRWLLTDVFEHCGITTPAEARADPGCITLSVQHRFGLDVMRLANAVAYDGSLRAADGVQNRQTDDPEIVVVDTDQLGDLGWVRPTSASAGWWPAGALLSRVLVDYHLTQREQVGIVMPYRHQVEATVEALRDRESSATVPTQVGTAHRFQGRQFPVVVFDLVEDGRGDRWIGQARTDKHEWHREGTRLFTVAVTRTQTRLYLIGSRTQILNAAPGSPLAHVAALIKEGRVRTVHGTRLLGVPGAPEIKDAPQLGPFNQELAAILAQQVRVADIQDERQFYELFVEHLAAAKRSIWIWAPWTATRVESLLPELKAAIARRVAVTVFVRDPGDNLQRKASFERQWQRLRAVVPTVISINAMHQKIVIIDEQTVLLGSLNALSQSWTREVMLVMQGGHFARRLLAHEHAEVFAKPPRCAACKGTDVDLRRQKAGKWYWRCYAVTCPEHGKGPSKGWTQDVVFPRT